MPFWTYILRCADDDLERRIAEHQTGGFCDCTSRRRPATLAWSEMFGMREEALSAELIVKKWSRAKKEALMKGDWANLSFFAEPPTERTAISRTESRHEAPEK